MVRIKKVQIPELPVVNDYVPASFTPASDRSPFVRPRAELPQITQSFHEEGCDDITALVSRTVKDSLEHYSLDNLIMKGTYRDGAGQLWGIVQVGAHSVQNQKVKVTVNPTEKPSDYEPVDFAADKKYKMEKVFFEYEEGCVPNTFVGLEKDYLRIDCKNGFIKVYQIKPEGKNSMDAKSFYNGNGRNMAGETLG